MINLFKKNRCDSVISICSVGGNHPARVKYLNKKIYNDPIFSEKKEGQNRQELRMHTLKMVPFIYSKKT